MINETKFPEFFFGTFPEIQEIIWKLSAFTLSSVDVISYCFSFVAVVM